MRAVAAPQMLVDPGLEPKRTKPPNRITHVLNCPRTACVVAEVALLQNEDQLQKHGCPRLLTTATTASLAILSHSITREVKWRFDGFHWKYIFEWKHNDFAISTSYTMKCGAEQ